MYCTDMNSLTWDLEVAVMLKDNERFNEINELIKNYNDDENLLAKKYINSISKITKKYTRGVTKKLKTQYI